MKTNKTFSAIIVLVIGILAATTVAAQNSSVPDAYIQKPLAYAGNPKTVEGKTLVYYRGGAAQVTLVVCAINANNPTQCDVKIYEGFPDKSMYDFYKTSKNAFSDDQRKQMTFVDEAQCYFKKSENESLAIRQNLSRGSGAVIVR